MNSMRVFFQVEDATWTLRLSSEFGPCNSSSHVLLLPSTFKKLCLPSHPPSWAQLSSSDPDFPPKPRSAFQSFPGSLHVNVRGTWLGLLLWTSNKWETTCRGSLTCPSPGKPGVRGGTGVPPTIIPQAQNTSLLSYKKTKPPVRQGSGAWWAVRVGLGFRTEGGSYAVLFFFFFSTGRNSWEVTRLQTQGGSST